ncbi:hypothetical protein DOE51_10140 [Bdellovibrio sp. NC01]|nr:hypothetical protein DOE51_10140 [Bdellovibrio sp. NC01]
MKYRSARLLNERSGWLGLSVWDLAIVAYTLIIANSLLQPFGFELLAFPIAGIALLFLVNIRLKSRPKTIRDYLRKSILPNTVSTDKR